MARSPPTALSASPAPILSARTATGISASKRGLRDTTRAQRVFDPAGGAHDAPAALGSLPPLNMSWPAIQNSNTLANLRKRPARVVYLAGCQPPGGIPC